MNVFIVKLSSTRGMLLIVTREDAMQIWDTNKCCMNMMYVWMLLRNVCEIVEIKTDSSLTCFFICKVLFSPMKTWTNTLDRGKTKITRVVCVASSGTGPPPPSDVTLRANTSPTHSPTRATSAWPPWAPGRLWWIIKPSARGKTLLIARMCPTCNVNVVKTLVK